ncbi:MAG: S-layer homology domain-containing protein [Clostridia bacterium]|nr:S-layer homology domain-containing protein [Clostridia bacterium]
MKRILSIILSVIIILSTAVVVFAEEPKGDGTPPRYYTFEELTGLSREDVDHIVIRSGVDGVGYSTAYDKIITDIYNFINTKSFLTYPLEDVRDGWKYAIMFFDKNNNTSTYTISSGIIVPGKDGFMFKTVNEGALEIAVEKAYKQMALNCTNWASDYIIEANDLGITEDLADLEYKKPITREKFCEMIYNMLDKSMTVEWKKVSPNPFRDTVNERVFSLCLEGIIEGKGENTFAPDDFLTREEAATILIRTAQFMGIGMPENAYDSKVYDDENKISDWAFASVHYCRKLGVMIGTSETEFSPQDEYTAEQAIATILRLYEKSKCKIEKAVLKLVDKDCNIILTEKDVIECRRYEFSPQSSGPAVMVQAIDVYITDEGRENLKMATKKIAKYSTDENYISVLIDDEEIYKMSVYDELDSNVFRIGSLGIMQMNYVAQKINYSLKEEQRNVQTKAFFSGKENTFEIGFIVENENNLPISFKSNTSDFIDIEIYNSNGEKISLEQNSLSVLSEEIIEKRGMIFEEYPKDKLLKGSYKAVIKWNCQAAIDKGNGEFERIHLIDREIQFEIK